MTLGCPYLLGIAEQWRTELPALVEGITDGPCSGIRILWVFVTGTRGDCELGNGI